jgi:hypothetical protein
MEKAELEGSIKDDVIELRLKTWQQRLSPPIVFRGQIHQSPIGLRIEGDLMPARAQRMFLVIWLGFCTCLFLASLSGWLQDLPGVQARAAMVDLAVIVVAFVAFCAAGATYTTGVFHAHVRLRKALRSATETLLAADGPQSPLGR